MESFARLSKLPAGLLADVAAEPLPQSLAGWISALPEELLTIVAKVAESGHGVWMVGGSVREALSGRIPHDHDLTTTMEPDEVIDLFPDSIPTGAQYGTVTVRTEPGGSHFEMTTLRSDQEYLDGRRPESVKFGESLSEDLQRRDLTINSMAIDLSRCLLHDPFEGRVDLGKGVLRAVGEAEVRLSEDGLRIMRVYRFMDQAEAGLWQPDEELAEALKECQPMLKNVSVERIWHELTRILSGVHAAEVLSRLGADGILDRLLPSANGRMDFQRELSVVENPVEARLALLFHPESARDDLLGLKAPRRVIDGVEDLLRRLGRLPDPDEPRQLRLYRAALGARLHLQLSCEGSLDQPSTASVSVAMDSLAANRAGHSPLADGNWLAEQTGLKAGIRLGRLKAWLHYLQVENDLATLSEVEEQLSQISWQDGEPESWPRLQWP
jgi:tRNA nucleotidyltransferase/poly(A) polymerase